MRGVVRRVVGWCGAGLWLVAAHFSWAQDPVALDPRIQKVEFHNGYVRVLRARYAPGQGLETHEHPPRAIVFLTAARIKELPSTGKARELRRKAGEVAWSERTRHAVENIGRRPLEVIEVELRGAPRATPSQEEDPVKNDPQQFKLEFENARVRVLRFTLGPRASAPMHDRGERVSVGLREARLRVTLPDGSSTDKNDIRGSVSFQPAGRLAITNLGDLPYEAISIEFKPAPEPPVSGPVKFLRANGTDLAYIEQGQGEAVVLVHGALADYRAWAAQMEALAAQYHVIAYSRRYHTPNPWFGDGADYSSRLHAADLVALIEGLRLGPVHLVAHSAGGSVAILAALVRPELVRSLVLVEPGTYSIIADKPAGKIFLAEREQLFYSAREAFERRRPEQAVRLTIDSVQRPVRFDDLPEAIRRVMLDNAPSLRAAFSSRVSARPITCEDARKIKAPVLLVGGENSPPEFRLILDELERCLPARERALVPGASHGSPYEKPAAFNEAVLRFLSRRAAGAGH